MNETPIDLTPLDPEEDPQRTERVVGAALQRIRATSGEWASPTGSASGRVSRLARIAAMLLLGVGVGWFGRGVADARVQVVSTAALDRGAAVELASLVDELDVSDDQRSRIRTAVRARELESDELLQAVAAELGRLVQERDEGIRSVLSTDQRQRYEERVRAQPVFGFRRDYVMPHARVRIEAVVARPQ